MDYFGFAAAPAEPPAPPPAPAAQQRSSASPPRATGGKGRGRLLAAARTTKAGVRMKKGDGLGTDNDARRRARRKARRQARLDNAGNIIGRAFLEYVKSKRARKAVQAQIEIDQLLLRDFWGKVRDSSAGGTPLLSSG